MSSQTIKINANDFDQATTFIQGQIDGLVEFSKDIDAIQSEALNEWHGKAQEAFLEAIDVLYAEYNSAIEELIKLNEKVSFVKSTHQSNDTSVAGSIS